MYHNKSWRGAFRQPRAGVWYYDAKKVTCGRYVRGQATLFRPTKAELILIAFFI